MTEISRICFRKMMRGIRLQGRGVVRNYNWWVQDSWLAIWNFSLWMQTSFKVPFSMKIDRCNSPFLKTDECTCTHCPVLTTTLDYWILPALTIQPDILCKTNDHNQSLVLMAAFSMSIFQDKSHSIQILHHQMTNQVCQWQHHYFPSFSLVWWFCNWSFQVDFKQFFPRIMVAGPMECTAMPDEYGTLSK